MDNLKRRYCLLTVKDVEVHGDYIRVLTEKKNRPQACLNCHSSDILLHGISSITLKDSPYLASRVFLVINIKRFKCLTCKKTFLDQAPYRFKKSKMTEDFARCAKQVYRRHSLNKAAKILKVDRSTILNGLTVD